METTNEEVDVLKRSQPTGTGTVKVTFALPLAEAPHPTSVVGEFNGWDPLAHPLKKRSNGTRSATVELPAGTSQRFKYLSDGTWFCEPEADGDTPNDHGGVDSVIHV